MENNNTDVIVFLKIGNRINIIDTACISQVNVIPSFQLKDLEFHHVFTYWTFAGWLGDCGLAGEII